MSISYQQIAAPSRAPPASPPDPRALRHAEDEGRRAGFEDGRRAGYADGEKAALRAAQIAVAGVKLTEPTLATLPARHAPPFVAKPATAPPRAAAPPPSGDLPDGERACLIAIAQRQEGVRREQLQVLTGYKRSTRDAYILRLRNRQFVEQSGERIVATADGIAALGGSYDPLPTGEALRERVLRELPEGEKAVLALLISHYPNAVPREHIDEGTGFKRSTRDAYLQRLRLRQLVENVSGGCVKASDDLFEGSGEGERSHG